ncbi:MAG: hypothetical protein CO158_05810 [Piscirickettsiaceae bacterium CG_4_9_14_3_um_filter_43_564]|nr:TetR/AcrR family transcriptional regulator [Thiomicrospira sp.]OIP94275.1 MAG: hypothetical protein AUK56_09605 [Thiomicrospira sp. CG2_30_44_34]PIQ02793.1 MAG: hypothetical protein COW74_09930 [Piscirickettsiaceae bacterium CG18_big_fil_WC_8_21_14_2_50_44_103]PIU38607.1 MAG: hypothetical protein COT01_05935 [Piscirickettsiaceae bacterium CG07_land_8_20_14_0_80_44_28]PIW58463.1 MAG: hypothetical protein COW14_01305 [Piscirickettsiaceae bacterium CG12_big_fil_rev_8_21_14_0_65_44_934]PIW78752
MKDPGLKETRSKILLAAVRIWREDYSAPLKTVAKEAGVSRMTLHRYFCGRDSILLALVEQFVERISQNLVVAQQQYTHPVKQMECLVKNTHHLMEDYNFLFDIFEQKGCPESLAELFANWEAEFSAFFESLQTQGLIKPTIAFGWANALFEGVMKAGFRMRQKHKDHHMDLAEEIWQVYRLAIFTPQALAEAAD